MIELVPKRDLVELKGTYNEIMKKSFYEDTSWQEDYTHITLTDEEDVPDAIGKLRTVYHHLMKLDYDNERTKNNSTISVTDSVESKSPIELFSEFYELQNNRNMTDEQEKFMIDLIDKIWEDEQ